jgi:hypothetical protein
VKPRSIPGFHCIAEYGSNPFLKLQRRISGRLGFPMTGFAVLGLMMHKKSYLLAADSFRIIKKHMINIFAGGPPAALLRLSTV